jgi:hypothetical protein
MAMFCFQFEARPKATHSHANQVGGAMVNCWIQRDTLEEAESYARGSIADEDWTILRKEEGFLVTRETQDPEGMRYFEQAEIDKEVFVFHTWPLNAPDDGTPTV